MRAAPYAVICVALAFPTALNAQERPTRSVEDYLCAFAGKCSGPDETAETTKEAPETKGFRLIRPTAEKAGAAAQPSVAARAPSASASAPKSVRAPAAKPVRRKAPAYASTSKPKSKASQAAERRYDLRLSFELGSADLTTQAREEAKVFAQSLLRPELADKRFLIEGHTDSIGGRAYNLDLSNRRAAAVAQYLASLGVDTNRIETRGLGYDRPLSGRSPGSPDNRRVEALLVD